MKAYLHEGYEVDLNQDFYLRPRFRRASFRIRSVTANLSKSDALSLRWGGEEQCKRETKPEIYLNNISKLSASVTEKSRLHYEDHSINVI
jgi:hypothetical protein